MTVQPQELPCTCNSNYPDTGAPCAFHEWFHGPDGWMKHVGPDFGHTTAEIYRAVDLALIIEAVDGET
jgi:hypothetical protein